MSILVSKGSFCYVLRVKNNVFIFVWVVVRSDACGVAWGSYGGSVPFDFGLGEGKILAKIDKKCKKSLQPKKRPLQVNYGIF